MAHRSCRDGCDRPACSDGEPVNSWDDNADDADDYRRWSAAASHPSQLTLALLEDLAAVLLRHGYPPLTGYALAELTGSLYRIPQSRP
jgi:hypothetical protein